MKLLMIALFRHMGEEKSPIKLAEGADLSSFRYTSHSCPSEPKTWICVCISASFREGLCMNMLSSLAEQCVRCASLFTSSLRTHSPALSQCSVRLQRTVLAFFLLHLTHVLPSLFLSPVASDSGVNQVVNPFVSLSDLLTYLLSVVTV